MAEFVLDEDQTQIQDMMRKFASEELRNVARECDDEGALPDGVLAKVWELGITAQCVPEEYGGYGLGRTAINGTIAAEELAWGDLSLAIGALAPMSALVPILEFGTDAQKKNWLPNYCGESFYPAAAALMEPSVSFDPLNLATTATISGDAAVLNGEKCMVPLAGRAEQLVVYASTDAGVQAFVVDRGAAGMAIGDREEYMGLRAAPMYRVTFENCTVPLTQRLGDNGAIDYQRILNQSRATLAAMAVGVSRASWEYALNYAKERYAFGEPIASRQSIAFMLAEMAMEIDAMRLLAWRAAWRCDTGGDATRDATLAKNYCGEKSMAVVDYGVQILGGHGYIREHPVELWFRNGRAFTVLEGTCIL